MKERSLSKDKRKRISVEINEIAERHGSTDNGERIVFGKRVVSDDGIKAQIHAENSQLITISSVVLFGVMVTFGFLFSYQPDSTPTAAIPATVYYGNEYYVNYSGYDSLGLWLGSVSTVWTFAYDTSVGQFVLNGNSFFAATTSHPWYGSASINGDTNTATSTYLHAAVSFTIGGTSNTIINKVVSAGNYEVGTYGYLLGQSSLEVFFVVPLDE